MDLLELGKITMHQIVTTFAVSDLAAWLHLIDATKRDKNREVLSTLCPSQLTLTPHITEKVVQHTDLYTDYIRSKPPDCKAITTLIIHFIERYRSDKLLWGKYEFTTPINFIPIKLYTINHKRGDRAHKYTSCMQRVPNGNKVSNIYTGIISANVKVATQMHDLMFIHNLGTTRFLELSRAFESLKSTRIKSLGKPMEKFYDYISMLCNKNNEFKIVPRPVRYYRMPRIGSNDVVQPYYAGIYCLVAFSDIGTISVYDRYGSTILVQHPKGISAQSCMLEAVILPALNDGTNMGWRCYSYKERLQYIFTDIYEYKGEMLWSKSPTYRQKLLDKVVPDNSHNPVPDLRATVDSNSSVIGIMVKQESLKSCVVYQPTRYNLDMCDRTNAIVYSHTRDHYYVCLWNRDMLKFVHWATIERAPEDYKDPTYNHDPIYVVAAQNVVYGHTYVRLYHTTDGYHGCEIKQFASKFDVYDTFFNMQEITTVSIGN